MSKPSSCCPRRSRSRAERAQRRAELGAASAKLDAERAELDDEAVADFRVQFDAEEARSAHRVADILGVVTDGWRAIARLFDGYAAAGRAAAPEVPDPPLPRIPPRREDLVVGVDGGTTQALAANLTEAIAKAHKEDWRPSFFLPVTGLGVLIGFFRYVPDELGELSGLSGSHLGAT